MCFHILRCLVTVIKSKMCDRRSRGDDTLRLELTLNMIAAISFATGFVANGFVGVPAQRAAAPVIHMNEAAAKAAWFAKQDTAFRGAAGGAAPAGAAPAVVMGSSAMGAARVLDRSKPAMYDDHSAPMSRLGVSGIQSARMPLDAPKPKPAIYDDHTYPMGRLATSGIPSARMPLDTAKGEGPEDKVY